MKVQSLAENLYFSTVRIDTTTANGQPCSGTGFLFAHKLAEDKHAPFIVTNKHVVQGMQSGSLTFHQRIGDDPKLGTGFRLGITEWLNVWFGHPSPEIDIAVAPFLPLETHVKQQSGIDLFYRYVTTEMIPSAAQSAQLDAIESVTFIGYPNGVWDTKNLLPVARRGTTATPFTVDFEGSPRFLIDASVFGGSSGSPVFLLNQGMYTDKLGGTTIGSRIHFLSVIAAVFYRTQLNQIIAVPVPTQTQPMAKQQEMIDLGIVFKASTVVETIEAFVAKNNV